MRLKCQNWKLLLLPGHDCAVNDLIIKIRQSKINSRSVAGPMGQMNRRPSVWCSKYFFFSWFLAEFFAKIPTIYLFIFLKNTKIKIKSFECPKSIRSLKKIMLGTSDAWSTIRLSNRHSDPAWIYLRLTDLKIAWQFLARKSSKPLPTWYSSNKIRKIPNEYQIIVCQNLIGLKFWKQSQIFLVLIHCKCFPNKKCRESP